MDELLQDLQKSCEIDRSRAEIALGTVLGFMGAQLPSPIMGRIKNALLTGRKLAINNSSKKDICIPTK